MSRALTLFAALALLGLGGIAAAFGPDARVDVLLGDARKRVPVAARMRVPVAELVERVPLEDGQEFRVVELGRDVGTSHHLVAIRTAETPHRHDRHDLFVVMLRGHGTWRVGDDTKPVGEGSLLYVPRGTVHAFGNESAENAIAYAVYVPPFDGEDRVEVGE